MNTTCYNHPTAPAPATCVDCGQPICAVCTKLVYGDPYCPLDYQIARHDPVDNRRIDPHSSRPLTQVAPMLARAVANRMPRGATPIVEYPATPPPVPPRHTVVSPAVDTVPETSMSTPIFKPLGWAIVGMVAAFAEAAYSVGIYRMLAFYYNHRNSHDNSYQMNMAFYQELVFLFLTVLAIIFNGAFLAAQREHQQPTRRVSIGIAASSVAIILGIVALITTIIFIFTLLTIPGGMSCCG